MTHCKSLRTVLVFLLLACSLVPAVFAQAPPCALLPPSDPPQPCLPPLMSRERIKDYLHSTVGPGALLSRAAAAGIAQARNSPSAWEQGMAGYGRRFASRTGQSIFENAVRLGVESALGEDSRYYPSPRKDPGSRIAHIFRTTLLARTREGGETLAVGRLAGAFSSGLVSRSWQPTGHRGIGEGLESGAISYGLDFASHAFDEFWPDLRKHLPF